MKTHPLNVSYLVVGLVFLGIAGTWALRAADVVDTAELGWLFPLVLVGSGVIGLVAFAAKGMSNRRTSPEPVADDQDIAGLEAAAFAPYRRDQERAHVLETEPTAPTDSAETTETTDSTEGENQ